MSDGDLIFKRRMNRKRECPARAVLELLGFEGLMDFSKRAGVNHKTVGELLGIYKSDHKKHHVMIIEVNDALHSAFMDERKNLDKASQKFICALAKNWLKDVVANKWYEKKDEAILGTTAENILDRRRKRKNSRAALMKALGALEWK